MYAIGVYAFCSTSTRLWLSWDKPTCLQMLTWITHCSQMQCQAISLPLNAFLFPFALYLYTLDRYCPVIFSGTRICFDNDDWRLALFLPQPQVLKLVLVVVSLLLHFRFPFYDDIVSCYKGILSFQVCCLQ